MNKSLQSKLSSWILNEPKKKKKINSLDILSSNNHEKVY